MKKIALAGLVLIVGAFGARAALDGVTPPVDLSQYGGTLTGSGLNATGFENHALSNVTASFTFDATMHNVVAGSRGTALAAAVTATLPACVTAVKGRTYGLKKVDTSSNAVTLTAATINAQTSTADLIDGAATVALTAQYAQVNVQCDGAGNWWRGFY